MPSHSLTTSKLSAADEKLLHRTTPGASAWGSGSGVSNTGLTKTRQDRFKRSEGKWVVGVVGVALVVRLWKIWEPSSVVFDEVHFGGFARKYILQTFFMDVHPPLAKMLIALSALIGGFDGKFDFKDIGMDYIEPGVPYVVMRLFPGLLGVAVIPIAYLTMRALPLSLPTSILGALLLTFENGLITQSRLILLDSPLIFFTALTTLFWVKFTNENDFGRPFEQRWWTYLALAGLSLGAVVSCKWVGLFTIALLGLSTIRQLWLLLGNLSIPPRVFARHFAARALCLIVLPVGFYMAMFQIHFWILNRSGDGDGFMSSEFQHTLRGHGMEDTYADVALGSLVSIRHVNTQGGYLHSHSHSYPGGSHQQQITLYPHRDDNNLWRLTNASSPTGDSAEPIAYDWAVEDFTKVSNNMKIRLEHVSTEKRLHSHDVRAPVSEVDFQNEISGYGFPGFGGDANDDFIVEIAPKTRGNKDRRKARESLRTLRSHFRLRHVMTGCYLFSHKTKLPDWGFEQQEVTCNKNPTWDNSLWYIETNTHPQLGPGSGSETVNYHKPGFMSKFLELQAVMWQTNAGLTDRHAYDSRPQSWPVLRRGINFWVKDHKQVYLVGNPVIWWGSTVGIGMYLVARGLLILREKRGYKDLKNPVVRNYDEICGFLVAGWALHYLPFFLMQRQLFLHHYFPALYFAILTFCAVFDLATRGIKRWKRTQAAVIILLLAIYCFSHFSPLTYGRPWTRGECESSKWLKTWDFSCADFHVNAVDYSPSVKGLLPSSILDIPKDGEPTTSAAANQPQAGQNPFADAPPPEEKTVALEGPQRKEDIPIDKSPDSGPLIETTAEIAQDTRAPVGKDAGAPEATFADAVGGGAGWQGGAEDPAGVVGVKQPGGGDVGAHEYEKGGEAPFRVPGMDEEARSLVEEAMENE